MLKYCDVDKEKCVPLSYLTDLVGFHQCIYSRERCTAWELVVIRPGLCPEVLARTLLAAF